VDLYQNYDLYKMFMSNLSHCLLKKNKNEKKKSSETFRHTLYSECVCPKIARTYGHPDGETDPRVSAELNHEIHVDKYTQDG